VQLSPTDALAFLFAGNATFTLVSKRTGTRYTFRVQKSEDNGDGKPPVWFVKTLAGPDNGEDYVYIGLIAADRRFKLTAKSKMADTSGPVVAIRWVLDRLVSGSLTGTEFWHEGRCGRCGRTLTVPESIERGLGPECAGMVD